MLKKRVLPAEWAQQECVQLTWPHLDSDWAPYLDEAVACFCEIAKEIAKRELLIVVCVDAQEVNELLRDANTQNIAYLEANTNDTWARDHGGITVFEEGKALILDFMFNGWGLKFASNFDNLITKQLYNNIFSGHYGYVNRLNFVLEGGGIESDGEGTILTTSECLLSPNRNGGYSHIEIENILKLEFGADRVLWVDNGYLAGDDTDSHIDTLVRFCSQSVVTYVKCDDENDEHYLALKKMEDELKAFKTADGNPYTLIPLPMADKVYFEEERLPATYANFLIINGAVLVPTYNSPKDKIALDALQKVFSDREVVGIDCSVLIKQHGSLHCVTMQYPKNLANGK